MQRSYESIRSFSCVRQPAAVVALALAAACGPGAAGGVEASGGGSSDGEACEVEGAVEVEVARACVCHDGAWTCAERDQSDGDDHGDVATLPVGSFVRLLFVVDGGPGMAALQRSLAEGADRLVRTLGARGFAVAATVISQDAGTVGDACPAPADPAGTPAFTSCRARLSDFASGPDTGPDPAAACTQVCDLDALPQAQDPFGGGTFAGTIATDPDGATAAAEALACAIPLGNTGCRFAQPVAALDAFAQDPPALWTVEGPTDLVIFAGDGPDCSANDPSIFDPNGTKTFFDDPNATEPTQAVCWNAGVVCEGDPAGYDACTPADLDAMGAPTGDADAAALVSVMQPWAMRRSWAAFPSLYGRTLTAVVGGFDPADPAADPPLSEGTDPGFAAEHGIDPGCTGEGVAAAPPVRTAAFAGALHKGGTATPDPLHVSACSADLPDRLTPLVDAVEAARTHCMPAECLFDADPTASGVQPLCAFDLIGTTGADVTPLPACTSGEGAAAVPPGAMGCVRYLPGEAAGCDPDEASVAFRVELADDAPEELRLFGNVVLGPCLAGAVDEAGTCDPSTPGR